MMNDFFRVGGGGEGKEGLYIILCRWKSHKLQLCPAGKVHFVFFMYIYHLIQLGRRSLIDNDMCSFIFFSLGVLFIFCILVFVLVHFECAPHLRIR